MLYKDGILWCSCTDKKRWKSESCRQNFYHTRNKVPLRKTKISIDAIQCDKNDYYVVDCNVCLCKSGILDEASCTNRTCLEGSKVDDCKYGQVLRLDGELCTCSELGFYIDKLCIKVKGVNTKIEQKDLAILTHEVKGMKENKRTLKDKNLKCEPNSIFNVDCNKCWCSEDGKDMKCTAKLCSPEILKQTMFQGDKKKTIKLNTIQTGNDFEMRAKNDELEKIKLHAHKLGLFEEDEGDEDHDQDNSDYKPIKLTDASGRFPLLNLKVKCTPGRIYTKGCQRCFCCNQKKPRCTNKPCKAMSKKVKVPSDVTPSISGLDFARMASLPHEAAKCTPGKSYKVRCNRCICLANGNLLCENKLCASIAEINANTAWRYNGNTCKSDEDPPHPGDCITCKCEKKEFKCNPRPKCIPRKFNSASILKNVKHLEINSTMDCVPHMVYKQACNDCYCQADHSLRCTRKGCLSYTQVKKLDEVRQKLLQEGL
ncbi:uncharacterized protein LOC126376861 isoform X2 [Pectinophora gossypiella]|uniref:uncharacterized protein LOC126376861 isoform X2 n=1 Tax=Pectinophora gossypiella TaxID=13191 RepID=UPI00214EDA0D|nr:uncharacterized protein LOC126376861 isoform X2 [Pectinophora gossypiella]